MGHIIKHWALWLAALLVFFSCGKEPLGPGDVVQGKGDIPIVFDLTAHHPEDTKAKKSGWEGGDVIFVFFTDVTAPKYLKMSYDGSAWTTTEMDGESAGSLGLSEGASGTMRAVYLPFGNGETVSAGSDGSFVFSKIYYSYYLTATLDYTVTNHTVSGAFDMRIPENYVQFFVPDASATDEAFSLGTDAIVPVGVASVVQVLDGDNKKVMIVNETTDKDYRNYLPGYAYGSGDGKGLLFSGKLSASYDFGKNYYFALRKESDKSRRDFFIAADKALNSHDAILLPVGTAWQDVGNGKSVVLKTNSGTNLGTWSTCNYNVGVPNNKNATFYFSQIEELTGLPTQSQFKALIDNCDWYKMSLGTTNNNVNTDVKGVVVKVKNGNGFMFLPLDDAGEAHYWGQEHYQYEDDNKKIVVTSMIYCLYISNGNPSIVKYDSSGLNRGFVRRLQVN